MGQFNFGKNGVSFQLSFLTKTTISALILTPTAAMAIPSPELVIGSVSSLTQVFAVGFALVSGAGAVLARKLGINLGTGGTKMSGKLIAIFGLCILALLGANYWQYTTTKRNELARMQATLVRPAQFSGTKIKDKTLVETSFSKQQKSALGLSTDDLSKLLASDKTNQTLLFDVRETGENAMGSLPGATHVRYPDFLDKKIDLYQVIPTKKRS